MSYIKLWEKFWVTDMYSKGVTMGAIDIDQEKCIGCGLCAKICPGNSLVLDENKHPASKDPEMLNCAACGACAAICSEEAIVISQKLELTGMFKTLRRGPLARPRLFEELAPKPAKR